MVETNSVFEVAMVVVDDDSIERIEEVDEDDVDFGIVVTMSSIGNSDPRRLRYTND